MSEIRAWALRCHQYDAHSTSWQQPCPPARPPVLRARLGAVDRARTRFGPPFTARTCELSITALDQSSAATVHLVPRPEPQPNGRVPKVVSEIELVLLRSAPLEQQPRAELLGRNLLGEPLADVQEFLFSVDARAERRGQLVEAPGL